MEILTVKNDEFEMDYFTFGTGKQPLVILPGISVQSVMLSAEAVAEAYSCFGNTHTVWLFDRAKQLKKGCTVTDMADDTAKAMKQLGLQNADIFGTSQGGMIAMCIAVRYPELVHKLVLGSTSARLNDKCSAVLRNWVCLADEGETVKLNRDMSEKVYSPSFYEKYRDYFKMTENNGSPQELQRFSAMAGAAVGFDIYNELDRIKCPALVIGADEDKVVSGRASEEIAEKLGCELYIYKGYGHAVYDEASDYKERLMAFFNEK